MSGFDRDVILPQSPRQVVPRTPAPWPRVASRLAALMVMSGMMVLAGCATSGAGADQGSAKLSYCDTASSACFGTVERLRIFYADGSQSQPTEVATTAIAGGAISNQTGRGTGRVLAAVGCAGGSQFAGHAIQSHTSEPQRWQEISIRLDSGRWLRVSQPAVAGIHAASRVRVTGRGPSTHVAPAYGY